VQSPDKVARNGEPCDGDQADISPVERTTIRAEDRVATPAAIGGLVRDRNTWTFYWLLGLVGFLLNGLGAALGSLKDQLHVDRAQVAFYPTLFAAGLLCIGVIGPRLVGAVGRVTLGRVSLGLIGAGALLLCSGWRPATMVGAALLGLGSATVMQLVSAGLADQHGARAPAALGEANALSSAASVAGPLAVAAGIVVLGDWRVGYLLLPLAAIVLLAPRIQAPPRTDHPADLHELRAAAGLPPGPMLGRWMTLLLSISVEFCMVFWVADALSAWHGAGAGLGAASTGLFVAGMAASRTGSQRLIGDRHPLRVTSASAAVALAGFAVFWAAPDIAVAAVGLVVMGAGVALLYPLSLARVVAAWPDRPDGAAARAGLASGMAIGVSPLVLAALADLVGLRTAYLLVPCILVGLILRSRWAYRREQVVRTAQSS
jgi:MFS family permease